MTRDCEISWLSLLNICFHHLIKILFNIFNAIFSNVLKSINSNDTLLLHELNIFIRFGEGGWVVRRCHVSFVTGASS